VNSRGRTLSNAFDGGVPPAAFARHVRTSTGAFGDRNGSSSNTPSEHVSCAATR